MIKSPKIINRTISKQIIIIMLISSLIFYGCSQSEQIKLHEHIKDNQQHLSKQTPSGSFFGNELVSITDQFSGQLNKIVGWLNNNEVLVVVDTNEGSSLFIYNIYTGKYKLLFETIEPIVDIAISPTLKYIFIHSAPTTYLANVYVIDQTGETLFEDEFNSVELYFQWNRFSEHEIAITSFQEDWTYQVFIANIDSGLSEPLQLEDPFPQWLKKDVIGFLNWDMEKPSLTAPLISYNLVNNEKETISSKLIDFSSYNDYLFTISVSEQENDIATYSFMKNNHKEPLTFTTPLLTRFSGWLIPFYTMNEAEHTFYSLRPYRSGAADLYGDKFELVAYNLAKNTEKVINSNLENEPITISPDGKNILYGFQFEKVINVLTGDIVNLVEK